MANSGLGPLNLRLAETGAPVLHRIEISSTETLEVESLVGGGEVASFADLRVPDRCHSVLYISAGTLLLRAVGEPRWTVVAPDTVVYLPGGIDVAVGIARGQHRLVAFTWLRSAASTLSDWLAEQGHAGGPIHCKPIQAECRTNLQRVEDALTSHADNAIPLAFGQVHCSLAYVMVGPTEIGLAPLPPELPPTIAALTRKVRARPEAPWPLKDASDQVGYSAFHFSRVFKAMVGYGFHEFVDRCRTEHAVNLLCKTDDPVEVIASAAGFGTSQSLRESVKDHLGLLPSELRGVQDGERAR